MVKSKKKSPKREKLIYWTPAHVLENKILTPSARLLFQVILAYTHRRKGCNKENSFFAEILGCQKRTVQSWIEELKFHGYISIVFIEEQTLGKDRPEIVRIIHPIIKMSHRKVQEQIVNAIKVKDSPQILQDESSPHEKKCEDQPHTPSKKRKYTRKKS
jgi:hypothetical protein